MDATQALVPAIGDLVWICAECGCPGVEPHWFRVLGSLDALTFDHAYVRGYPADDPGRYPQSYYVQVSRLTIRREAW